MSRERLETITSPWSPDVCALRVEISLEPAPWRDGIPNWTTPRVRALATPSVLDFKRPTRSVWGPGPKVGRKWRISGWVESNLVSLKLEKGRTIDEEPPLVATEFEAHLEPAEGGTLIRCRSYATQSESDVGLLCLVGIVGSVGLFVGVNFFSGAAPDIGSTWGILAVSAGIASAWWAWRRQALRRSAGHHDMLMDFIAKATDARRQAGLIDEGKQR